MPRPRKTQTPPQASTSGEIRTQMVILRDDILSYLRRGYGWPGVQQALARDREALDQLRVAHPEIWKSLPPEDNT